MVNIIVQLSKYLMILMITVYTYLCFSIFGYYDPDKKKHCLRKQNVLMFVMHLTAFLVMYLEKKDTKILALYLMQVTLLGGTILLYSFIYPKVSRLVVNNMCMLLSIGFIMITRLNYDKAAKQYLIAAAGIVLCLVIPIIIRKARFLSEWRILYGIVGIVSLAVVVVVGKVSYGAMLGFTVAGINIQPSELVKIVFVFFVASSFKRSTEFKELVVTTAVAAFHVLILVASKDLGAALIIFVVYLVMLYVATHQPLYILAGLGAGSAGAVVAYHLFTHVKTRVNVWRDPFGTYDKGGYQVAQSLFAIGTGGWFGAGLYQGQPDTIPVSAEDFIFSAISEEMGLIYAMCLILICVSCYVMFLNIAMQLHNLFYKMVALGLGTCYIFQVFLTIGGAIKFIPSTGVTLPLVSYGGSSLISTLIMFAIIQGLYILREDEEEDIERRKKERLRAKRSRQESAAGYREAEYDPQRAKRSQKARKEAAQGKARKKQRVR